MLNLAHPGNLRALPRDARDTLFLLAVIAWVILPQVNHLPLWCSVLAALVLVWRGRLALLGLPLPGRWWLAGTLALTIGATLWTHRTVLGRDAGVTLIVVLLALKTLELRARRDAFVVFFLGFFTMLTNFLFSQSLLTAAAMLVGLMGLLTALVNAHMPVGKPPLAEAARTAAWMTLLGAPIMAVLFVLFPRVAPLWGVPNDTTAGRSGLAPSMQVGNIASLALDDGIAMRIRFEGQMPRQDQLYFRGPVLTHFDGREWRPLSPYRIGVYRNGAPVQPQGTPVNYEVTLEAHSRPWVFALDVATRAPALAGFDLVQTSDLQWLGNRPINELVRYKASSFTSFRYGPPARDATMADVTELPPGFNPRTLQLAVDMRRDPRYAQADAATLSTAVLERLRTGGYSYTLEPGVYGTHVADEFWFDRKAGFCEHIASAYVLLMRALDVPARVVTGYQGGELNSVDGYWVVRQADAHAWAEIWQPGLGWTRVDPTGAVSPGRVGSFERLAAPRGAVATAIGLVSPNLLLQLRATWEAVNNRWNQWVLNYSKAQQLDLLKKLGFTSPSWEDLGYLLSGLLVAASLVGAAWTLWERRQHDPWLRLLRQAQRKAAQYGEPIPAHSPPRALATHLKRQFGEAAHDPVQWLLRLEQLRYAAPATAHASSQAPLRDLRRQFRSLAWPPPSKTS